MRVGALSPSAGCPGVAHARAPLPPETVRPGHISDLEKRGYLTSFSGSACSIHCTPKGWIHTKQALHRQKAQYLSGEQERSACSGLKTGRRTESVPGIVGMAAALERNRLSPGYHFHAENNGTTRNL